MALIALRSRRLLPTTCALISRNFAPATAVTGCSSLPKPQTATPVVHFQSRRFRSTPVSFLSTRSTNRNDRDDEKLDPDAILFEGCDYNHWLITMEFPKDPKPTPEEMVETYVQTCAKGLNISVEEAKKKIYACSTTTYQGFQAVMTEAESEQFEGLPGVVFVLPDSYIDPVNKEYGGDKYINGTIIPRPPPIQYNRGRNDRNKPRYDSQRGPQSNFNSQQGRMPGDGRNFGHPQNIPQQNYGPPGQVSPPAQQNGGGGLNFNQPGQGNYYPQDQRGPPPGDQRGFGTSGSGASGDTRNYFPPGGSQNFGPGPTQNFGPRGGAGFVPGPRVEQRHNQGFAPGAGGGYGLGGRTGQGPVQDFGHGGGYGPGPGGEQGHSHGLRPAVGGSYGPGPRGEQETGQGVGLSVGRGYGPGARGQQEPRQGFVPNTSIDPGQGGDSGQGKQGR